MSKRPRIVLPLSAVFSNKWRLVVNASRALNLDIKAIPVKLETLSEAETVVLQGDYQCKTLCRRRCGQAFKGPNEPAASPEGKVVGSRPCLRQTQSKLVVRKTSAIWAGLSNGIVQFQDMHRPSSDQP